MRRAAGSEGSPSGGQSSNSRSATSKHSGRRGDHVLQERRFSRPLRRTARDAHRQQSARTSSPPWPAPITRATNAIRSSSASMAPRSKTDQLEEYFKMVEEAKRRRPPQRSARRWACSPSTRNSSAPACRSGCPGARRSSRNWKSLAKETEFRRALCAREDAAHREGEKCT